MPTPPVRVALSDVLLASARNVQGVMAGKSLSDTLQDTAPSLRPATQAVVFHVMRRLGTARAIKQALVRRTPSNALLDALLLVSLALLDTAMEHEAHAQSQSPREDVDARQSVPVYAVHTVVDQSVKALAGLAALRPFKGLVNATLRNFTRERPAILAQLDANPEAKWNHPAWWVAQLQRAYPDQWQALLQAANRPGRMHLRVNRRRASMPAVLQALQAEGIAARQAGPFALTLDAARPVHQVPGFDQGWWSVQDLAAQKAAELLPLANGMRVLDACAAPGGKTAHMLERADVDLLALDADSDRLVRVTQNLDRLGLRGPNVATAVADAADLDAWWDGKPFDAVLADVPCTASGVVRRHPDIRWLRREPDIAKTAALQRDIVDALWRTVKPGGHLLYATCSIFPQEGEQQARGFASRHDDARRLDAPGQLLPLSDDAETAHDGFFYALFMKRA